MQPKPVDRDEYTGEALPEARIREAMSYEMASLCKEVIEGIPTEEALADPDRIIVGGRWVTSNKQDAEHPDCRGRFVGKGINHGGEADAAFYAATPPLEAKRMLFSIWARERVRAGVKANRFCAAILRGKPSLIELYGQGRIKDRADGALHNLNKVGQEALDLRTCKPNGDVWDFTNKSDRLEALRFANERKPTWVIGKPPCTAFSTIMGWNFKRMNETQVRRHLAIGRLHLHFVLQVYALQLAGGRHFLHEHPAGASSRSDPPPDVKHVAASQDECRHRAPVPVRSDHERQRWRYACGEEANTMCPFAAAHAQTT